MSLRPLDRGLFADSDYAVSKRSEQCPINQIFNLPTKIEGGRGDQLRHEDGIEILDRVHPEQGRRQTAPIIVAFSDGA